MESKQVPPFNKHYLVLSCTIWEGGISNAWGRKLHRKPWADQVLKDVGIQLISAWPKIKWPGPPAWGIGVMDGMKGLLPITWKTIILQNILARKDWMHLTVIWTVLMKPEHECSTWNVQWLRTTFNEVTGELNDLKWYCNSHRNKNTGKGSPDLQQFIHFYSELTKTQEQQLV